MSSATKPLVVPAGAQALIPDAERVKPLWLDLGGQYDVFLADSVPLLQQTLQWFRKQYGTVNVIDFECSLLKRKADILVPERGKRFHDAVAVVELLEETISVASRVHWRFWFVPLSDIFNLRASTKLPFSCFNELYLSAKLLFRLRPAYGLYVRSALFRLVFASAQSSQLPVRRFLCTF